MPSYTWPLTPDPALPSPGTPAEVAQEQAAAQAAVGLPSFLGVGLLRPFRRDKKTDFASGSGEELVRSCVGQILGTKANSATGPGEIPWRTDFGSRLHLLRHRNNTDVLGDLAAVMVQEAIAKWEPRVAVVRTTVEKTTDPRRLIIRVKFNVVDRGGRVLLANQETAVPVTLPAA